MMQGWKVEAATRIFLREDHCLNAGRHWAASVLPILEPFHHLSALCHRDLTLATIGRVVGRWDMTPAFDFC